MPLSDDDDVRAHLRAMQLLWALLLGAVAAIALLAVFVGRHRGAPLAELGATVFYASAFVNLAALLWAFAMQHQAHGAIQSRVSPEARIAVADRIGRRAIVPLAAAGFFAAGGSLASGQWIQLAFLLPIFGFGLLFFPTDRRARRFLGVGDDAPEDDGGP